MDIKAKNIVTQVKFEPKYGYHGQQYYDASEIRTKYLDISTKIWISRPKYGNHDQNMDITTKIWKSRPNPPAIFFWILTIFCELALSVCIELVSSSARDT